MLGGTSLHPKVLTGSPLVGVPLLAAAVAIELNELNELGELSKFGEFKGVLLDLGVVRFNSIPMWGSWVSFPKDWSFWSFLLIRFLLDLKSGEVRRARRC